MVPAAVLQLESREAAREELQTRAAAARNAEASVANVNGWYPRRRWKLEYLERGEISLLDFGVYDLLADWADYKTGVCSASAEKIRALCPLGFSYKSIQRSLEKLERSGLIKRWMIRGRKGNYPILVCRHLVRDASMTWRETSGAKTSDFRNVQFDDVHDPSLNRPRAVRDDDRDVSSEVSAIKEVRVETSERRSQSQTTRVREKHSNDASFYFSGDRLKITQKEHGVFTKAYEGTDLDSEYRRMDSWLVSNRRNYRNFGRFANSWLSRQKIPRTESAKLSAVEQRSQRIAAAIAATAGIGLPKPVAFNPARALPGKRE